MKSTSITPWLRAHPGQAVLLALSFIALGALAGFFDAWSAELLIAAALAGVATCLWIRRGLARMMLLAAAIAIPFPHATSAAETPDEEFGIIGVGVGVGVLVGFGFGAVKMIRFCQRKFPRTNSPPANARAIASPSHAALWAQDAGSGADDCADNETSAGPTLFAIHIDPDHGPTTTATLRGSANFQSLRDYRAEFASAGLALPRSADGSASFSIDGAPCSAEMVPMRYTGGILDMGDGAASRVTIERSPDMRSWKPVIVVDASKPFRFEDASVAPTMFYRVTTRRTNHVQ